MSIFARITETWRERGAAGLGRAGFSRLLRLPRCLARRLVTPWGVFAATYTIIDNTRVTLYTDDPTLFQGYAPRESLCAHLGRRTVRVSLVAPVKEEAANAAEWCTSIAQQTRPPDEIIVVDAGSRDGTLEILRSFAAHSAVPFHILVEAGCNIARARNLAISHAAHSIIAATDFGCRPRADWLERLVAPFEANADTRVAAGLYLPVDRQHHPKWRGFPIFPNLQRINPSNFLPSNRSIAFTRQAWQAVGGYPEWLTLTGEDTWFDRELERHGGAWAFVPEAQVEWQAPENFIDYCRKVFKWTMGDGESGLHSTFYWRYVLQLSVAFGSAFALILLALLGVVLMPVPAPVWSTPVAALCIAGPLMASHLTGVSVPILFPEVALEIVHVAGFLTGARRRREALKRRLAPTRGMFFVLSGVPVDDTGGGARCTQLTLELLHQGFAVTFLHKFPKFEQARLDLKIGHPNLFHYALSEFRWDRFMREQGQWLDEKPLAAIVEFPLPDFLPLIQTVREHRGRVIYDLLDPWDTSLGGNWYTREIEDEIIAASDVLVATAAPLVERLQAQSGRAVALLPNAVNLRLFDACQTYERPADMPEAEWTALYTGALWGEWFDWDLLVAIAQRYPNAAVVVIGDYCGQCKARPPNLRFLGLKPQRDLPAYLDHSDVAFIPWKINAITNATSPLKVYEYLAMGKPVVAPAIEPLRRLPGVFLAHDAVEFLARLEQARTLPIPSMEVAGFIAANNWQARVDRLLTLVEQARQRELDATQSA